MANPKKIDPLLTTSDVARMLNVHINTVRRWSNQGILKTYRIGSRGDRRFREADIASFLLQEDSSTAKAAEGKSSLGRLDPNVRNKILVDYKV